MSNNQEVKASSFKNLPLLTSRIQKSTFLHNPTIFLKQYLYLFFTIRGMNEDLRGMKVAILATDGFEESELLEPKKALEEIGAKTIVISPNNAEFIQGMKHDEKGKKVQVDLPLEFANPDRFDALLLPGGALNADKLRAERRAQDFVKKMDRYRKPIAIICHAPWLLVSANLVRGRTLTSYYTIQDDIRNAGGKWVDEEVVRYDNWLSSRQPSDIPAFNKEMLKLILEHSQQERSAYGVAM
jgi:protease I